MPQLVRTAQYTICIRLTFYSTCHIIIYVKYWIVFEGRRVQGAAGDRRV